MRRCSEIYGVIDRLPPGRPLPERLLAHVAQCEDCARISAQHLLGRCPAQHLPDENEDEAVLASLGMAGADVTMRLKSDRAANPDFAADWQAIEDLHAQPAPRTASSRRARPNVAWLAAAGLLIAAIGGVAAVALLSPEVPQLTGLLPRGDEPAPRYELAIGEPMRFCRPGDTCRWNAHTEPLVVHYRGQAVPVRITIRDALGEHSQLYPDLPDSFLKPTVHSCPPDQWCVIDGGLYSAPIGGARLCVETADGTAEARHCFNLEVID